MSKKHPRVPGLTRPTPRFWWRGIVVSDSLCGNPDCRHELHEHDPAEAFAYTVGLHDRLGLPELRLSAHPRECSEMPVMPVYDLGRVLNAVTETFVADNGAPALNVIDGWPGGFEMRIGVPSDAIAVPAETLECYQTHPDALVVEVEWCAHRERRPA
jgi:hypothetical protein